MTECFRCGDDDHTVRDCPEAEPYEGAPATHHDPLALLRRSPGEVCPPTEDYLKARATLRGGTPRRPRLTGRELALAQLTASRARHAHRDPYQSSVAGSDQRPAGDPSLP